MNPFNYCALAYADQWLGKDEQFCKILPDQSQNLRLDTLHEALKFYRVTRNWPGNGIQRFQPLLKILDEISISKPSTDKDRTEAVVKVMKELKSHTHKELFSLATKMLWIWFKHPFIIYDNNAARSIGFENGLKSNQAEDYYAKWLASFENAKSDIKEACNQLPQQHSWLKHSHKISDKELRELSEKPFFHHRVFDNFLWSREERGIENNYIDL